MRTGEQTSPIVNQPEWFNGLNVINSKHWGPDATLALIRTRKTLLILGDNQGTAYESIGQSTPSETLHAVFETAEKDGDEMPLSEAADLIRHQIGEC